MISMVKDFGTILAYSYIEQQKHEDYVRTYLQNTR